MPIARECILPPAPPDAWRQYAGLGAAAGGPLGLLLGSLSRVAVGRAVLAGSSWWIAANAAVLVLLLIPVVLLLRVTQRWGAVLGFAVALAVAAGLADELREALARGDGGARVSDWLDGDELMGFAVLPLAAVGMATLARAACRGLFVRAVELSPEVCSWCGYARGSPAITRCPECGRDASDAHFRSHGYVCAVAGLARRWKMLLAIALTAFLLLSIAPVWTRTIPSARLYRRFPEIEYGGSSHQPGVWARPYSDLWINLWLPDRPASPTGFIIDYTPGDDPRASQMLITRTSPSTRTVLTSSPRFSARLNDMQTRWVLDHGVPEGLLAALREQATRADSRSIAPPAGWNETFLDPATYFPN